MKHIIAIMIIALLAVAGCGEDFSDTGSSKHFEAWRKNDRDSLAGQGNFSIQNTVAPGKIATVAVSDNLLGYDHKGAGMSYHLTNSPYAKII